MPRTHRGARVATSILRDATRNGQETPSDHVVSLPKRAPRNAKKAPTNDRAGACIRIRNTHQGAQVQQELAVPMRAPLPDTLPADLPADHPLDVVIGAHALHSAQTAARSLLSRAVFLADAPAAELATPYTVRRAAQGMANDAAELCRGLADIERHLYAALDTLAAANDARAAELDALAAKDAAAEAELDTLAAEIATIGAGLARLAAAEAAAGESEGRSHAS